MHDYESIYSRKFNFNNKKLTLNKVSDWERVKVYTEGSHFDRILLKDVENNLLYLYEFYEYVNFSGGDDEIYTTYALVKDENDADNLNKMGDIRRTPFFRVQPNYEIIISE